MATLVRTRSKNLIAFIGAFLTSFIGKVKTQYLEAKSNAENLSPVRHQFRLAKAHAGQRGAFNISFVIVLVVLVMLVAAAVPEAISSINGADQSGWSTGEIALWGILGLVIIAAVVFGILRLSGLVGGRN